IQHAVIVERPATAQVGSRDDHSEACVFKDIDGGFGRVRMEIVVEGIRPQDDVAESMGAQGPHPAFVIMRKELSLVCRYVDAHGAVALAALAGEAQIERLFYLLAAPAVADNRIVSVLAL